MSNSRSPGLSLGALGYSPHKMVRDKPARAFNLTYMLTSGYCLDEFDAPSEPVPLPNVSSSVLKKVLEYLEYHRNDPLPTPEGSRDDNEDPRKRQVSEIGEWDQKFIQVDQEMLFEIILAANYLDIKPLL